MTGNMQQQEELVCFRYMMEAVLSIHDGSCSHKEVKVGWTEFMKNVQHGLYIGNRLDSAYYKFKAFNFQKTHRCNSRVQLSISRALCHSCKRVWTKPAGKGLAVNHPTGLVKNQFCSFQPVIGITTTKVPHSFQSETRMTEKCRSENICSS